MKPAAEIKDKMITIALSKHNGNRSAAAKDLKMPLSTLWHKITKRTRANA
jgi:transcriptional regulator with PAS, ATPase and Fis domain